MTTAGPVTRSRRVRPRWLAGAVAAMLVFTLTGATPGRPGLVVRWNAAVGVAGFALGVDGVYLSTPDGVVASRDAMTGQIRWEAPVDLLPEGRLSVGAGIAGVEVMDQHVTYDPRNRVILLRAATGDVLGSQTANMLGPTTDGSRFILQQMVDDACPHPVCLNLMVMDAATGQIEVRPLSVPAGDVVLSAVEGSVEAYGTYDELGTVRIYDAGSGELLDRADVRGGLSRPSMVLTPDRLFVLQHVPEGAQITSYGRRPITPQWTYTTPVGDNAESSVSIVAGGPCGWALCIRSADRTTLLDQATGRPRFTTTDDVAGTVTNGVLVTRLHPDPDELPQPLDVLILDPDTGQVRSTVARADLIGWTHSDGRALLVQDGDGYTAFVAVEATGQTRILGRDEGRWVNCEARAEILACSDSLGHLRVWTLTPREGGS